MTSRRPLVMVAGALRELLAADTLTRVVALPYAATLAADPATTDYAETTLTGDATLNPPTAAGHTSQAIQHRLLASSTARTVTMGSGWIRIGGLAATYSVPAGQVLAVAGEYSALRGGWLLLSAAPG